MKPSEVLRIVNKEYRPGSKEKLFREILEQVLKKEKVGFERKRKNEFN